MLDAMAATARADKETEAWVIDLSQHYDQLDACNGVVQ